LIKQEQYSRLIGQLTVWGYLLNPSGPNAGSLQLFTFAYDWRQDNRVSARRLAEAVDQWRSEFPGAEVWIMGHSNGGVVARWYIEKEGGHEVVKRLFLLASPWDGAPKALQVLQEGLDVFLLRYFNRFGIAQMLRETVLTFPSFYQLIPAFLPFLRDKKGETVDLFRNSDWLENANQNFFLVDALAFNRTLGTQLSVETCCFFGVKRPTTTRGIASLTPQGRLERIIWEQTEDGDGTVPVHSALHPNAAQKLPYAAGHGDLYVNESFVEKLRYELIDRYRLGASASVMTSRLKAQLQLDKDAYTPGEMIQVQAEAKFSETGLPIDSAKIELQMLPRTAFSNPMGIGTDNQDFLGSSRAIMNHTRQPGIYRAQLQAPQLPGYYCLEAAFHTDNDTPIHLEELFLVDQE